MDLQEEPGASFPDRRGLGPAMRRGSRLLMQRPEALLNHLSRFHVRRRVLGSERTVNERPRPVANLLAGAFLWRLSTASEWLAGNRPPRLTRRIAPSVNVTLIAPSVLTIRRRPIE
jgi:hypothetical protein